MPDQYLFSCICGNHWVSKKEKARCSVHGCYKINTAVKGITILKLLKMLKECD